MNPLVTMDDITPETLLENFDNIELITYTTNNTAVKTPVWFAHVGKKIYFTTLKTSNKVRRIRYNSMVDFGPCDNQGNPIGPYFHGKAKLLTKRTEQKAFDLLAEKFGRKFTFFNDMTKLKEADYAFFEINLLE